jgi:serine/threonine protein phosphatase 1
MRFVVIPDIHGELEALKAMLKACKAADERMRPLAHDFTLVQMGDLVDRGPESRGCVELMMRLQQAGQGRVVVLRGNHEDLLMESAFKPEVKMAWLQNGGPATLKSYGDDFEALAGPGGEHYRWMQSLPSHFEQEGIFFCHAGLTRANYKAMDPGRLRWDRPPLYRGAYKALVAGHTVTESRGIEAQDNIFRVDIGLGYGGVPRLEYLALERRGDELLWQVETAG